MYKEINKVLKQLCVQENKQKNRNGGKKMSRKRKKWLSRMLALCLILALLPINTAYADEVDTQDAVYQTKDFQVGDAAAQPEVKPEAAD